MMDYQMPFLVAKYCFIWNLRKKGKVILHKKILGKNFALKKNPTFLSENLNFDKNILHLY